MRLMHATSIGARLYFEQSTAISERSAAADENTGASSLTVHARLAAPPGLREAGMYIAATALLK